MDEIRADVAKWTPAEVESVTGVSEEEVYNTAKILAENRPGCVVWCMGTQHTTGNNNTRAYCILELALGNISKSGGGVIIFRGHDNVQGATDLGVLSDTLPGYYGLTEGSWKHWASVWGVDFEWIKTALTKALITARCQWKPRGSMFLVGSMEYWKTKTICSNVKTFAPCSIGVMR